MKRYSIVRVDENQCNKCEMYYVNDNGNNDCRLRLGASFLCDRYGDTKEQLIKKIAQILFKEKIKHFIKLFGKIFLNKKWKQIYSKEAYEQAKEIVEFLGVE